MNLFNMLKITAIAVIDVVILFGLVPTLANYFGFIGILAIPFILIIAGVFSYRIIKKIISNS